MTSFIWDEKIIPAIKAGAVGYAMKEAEPSELLQSIYKVHRGEQAFPPRIARKLAEEIFEQIVNSVKTIRSEGGEE
jgi:two-component system, NarL family, response regulator LiaR